MISGLLKKLFATAGIQITRMHHKTDMDHYVSLYGKDSVHNKQFYNIGAGSFFHPCWTNVDYYTAINYFKDKGQIKGINYDLFSLKPLPVPNSTACLLYTSHTIEHVIDTSVQNLFNEAYRILRKNGILRIVTPNIDIEYHAWRANDRNYWYWADDYSSPDIYPKMNLKIPLNKASTSQLFLEEFASTASIIVKEGSPHRIDDDELQKKFDEMPYNDALDYCTSKCSVEVQKKFPFHHINWFNREKLFRMLKQAGFEYIYHSAYGQSFSPVMRNLNYFDTTLPKVSLYVEAVKPKNN